MNDSYKAVADLLREIGYRAIAVCLEHDRNENFFKSCVNLVLLQVPKHMEEHARGILYLVGAIPDMDYKRGENERLYHARRAHRDYQQFG